MTLIVHLVLSAAVAWWGCFTRAEEPTGTPTTRQSKLETLEAMRADVFLLDFRSFL